MQEGREEGRGGEGRVFKVGNVMMSAPSGIPRPAQSSAWGPAMTASSAPQRSGVSSLGQQNPTKPELRSKRLSKIHRELEGTTTPILEEVWSPHPHSWEGGLGLVIASEDADRAIRAARVERANVEQHYTLRLRTRSKRNLRRSKGAIMRELQLPCSCWSQLPSYRAPCGHLKKHRLH